MVGTLIKYLGIIIMTSTLYVNSFAQTISSPKNIRVPVTFGNKSKATALVHTGLKAQITGLTFSKDDKWLAAGGYGEIIIWNIDQPQIQKIFRSPAIKGHVRSLQFLNKYTLVIGCGNPGSFGQVHIIDLNSNMITYSFAKTKDIITKVAISPDKNTVAAGDASGQVYIYNLKENQLIKHIDKLQKEITGLAFRHDTTKLGMCSIDGHMLVWNLNDHSSFFADKFSSQLMGFSFLKNGNSAAIAISSKESNSIKPIAIYSNQSAIKKIKKNGNNQKIFNLEQHRPLTLEIMNQGKYAFIGCTDGSLMVKPTNNANAHKIIRAHHDWITSIRLSNNESKLATADALGVIKIWSTADNRLVITLIQLCNGVEDWLAVTPRGFYCSSTPDLLEWEDKEDVPTHLINQLNNPNKVYELMLRQPFKKSRNNKRQK
ncbi:hypothetical protein E9993_12520 [Labilibacter sediminis]|nr:hypothetical protein E9993_12520 [Labilibacter sediminis]